MKLNLLFITKLLPRADVIGGPILIYHRIKNLSLRGHKITLIAPAYSKEDKEDKSLFPFCEEIILIKSNKKRTETEVEDLHKKLNRPVFFLSGDGGFLQNLEDAFKQILKKKYFDAIIAEYSIMGQYLETNQSLIPSDTATIISVHECYTKAFELNKKGEKISPQTIKELSNYEFKMYNSVKKILTLTQEDADILISYSPGLKDKISIVPHGVDTQFYTPPKEKTCNTKNILYIGNFEHYPNVDAVKNFINYCWQKIIREVPDAKFYAIGFNPPRELLDLRDDNIIIKEGGDSKNIRQFYWNSDVFVAPIELGTGFRGKLLEALACGLPVVATKLATFGINPINGKNMFVTDNYETFSNYVIMLLKDYKLWKKISREAIKLGKSFDHIYAAEKLEKVLIKAKELSL